MDDLVATYGDWLPFIFAGLMGISMLIYVILDGYDLGVGMLSIAANSDQKDRMIASIGPFWDANETWLVLGVGLLFIAFPVAYGLILEALYLPVMLMLLGLIFRGVAFDFRAKVPKEKKQRWNRLFFFGSLMAALSQGYMLGGYVTGFQEGSAAILFSCLIAVAVASGYCLIGGAWLIWRCEGELQKKSVQWMRQHLYTSCAGITLVSIATPLVSTRIFDKWFEFPQILALAPIPFTTGILVIGLHFLLKHMPFPEDRYAWMPFAMTVFLYLLSFGGLAYSFYPYVVPDQLKIVDSITSPESLMIVLVGTLFVLPVLIGYTICVYYIFRGKAEDLRYD